MSTQKPTKINQLLSTQPHGVVMQSFWLAKNGYSLDLQQRYKKGKWLEPIGTGAMIRTGDQIGYEGAIYALQQQSGLSVHPGGKTALSLLGKAHYLELNNQKIILFGSKGETLPVWFVKHAWGIKINYHQSSFLPPDIGLTDIELKDFSIKVSSAARAIMECLYLAPKEQELVECYELMEGLNNVKPMLIQTLLEECRSVKVKRLFMYLAEKADHAWLTYLNLEKVDFGQGKRSIVSNGVYNAKYKITISKELEEHGKRGI